MTTPSEDRGNLPAAAIDAASPAPGAGMRHRAIAVAGCRILVDGAIRGLSEERPRLVTVAERETPDLVALSISPEELETLQQLQAETEPRIHDLEKELSPDQAVFASKLEEFGEVEFPPPCFTAVLAWAIEHKIPAVPLDLDETAYADAFGTDVTFFQYWRHDRRRRKLAAYVPRSTTAAGFVLEWDQLIARLPGFGRLEARRERQMADRLLHYAKLGTHARILAVVDFERAKGVLRLLSDDASRHEPSPAATPVPSDRVPGR